MNKEINLTKEDARQQIELVFDALPLAERGFAVREIAQRCADLLCQVTENQKALTITVSQKGSIRITACPQCGYAGKWKYYDGCLGYESLVCPHCNLDVRDIAVHVNY